MHRAQPRRVVAGAAGQERQTALQADQQGGRGEVTDARRRQLDGERETVEAAADAPPLRHSPRSGRSRAGRLAPGRRTGGPPQTRRAPQCLLGLGGRQREWRHGEVMLGGKVQHRPARDDDLQPGAGGEKIGDVGAASRTCSKLSRTSSSGRSRSKMTSTSSSGRRPTVAKAERLGDRSATRSGRGPAPGRRRRRRRQRLGRCPRRPGGRGGSCRRRRDRSGSGGEHRPAAGGCEQRPPLAHVR